ncbi:UPF0280 family protein [Candidatus Omnitrophota bacterium]
MKTNAYQERFYRKWTDAARLHALTIVERETDLFVLSDSAFEKKYVHALVTKHRTQIEQYIKKNKKFLTALKPIAAEKNAPAIIKEMILASKMAGVGPMASVAGALSQYVANDLAKQCDELIIENGGDIFIKTKKNRRIGVYAGDSKFSGTLSLEISAQRTPLGICTSSGTVGHSLSFGNADAIVVVARSAIVADSYATAIANRVKKKSDIAKAITYTKSQKLIKGIIIIMRDVLSAWGDIIISSNKK